MKYFLVGFALIPLVTGVVSTLLAIAVMLAVWIKP